MSQRRFPSFAVPNNRAGLLFIILLLLVVAVTGLPFLFFGKDAKRPPYEHIPTTLTLPAGTTLDDLVKIQVDLVLDGSTLDGFQDGKSVRVHYLGVDTPEAGDRCFREALDRNMQLAGKQGDTVLLLPGDPAQDEFGRLLGYVFTPDGTSIDATLVAEGFASASTQPGAYSDQIAALQQQAQDAHRGCLWKQ